MKTCTKCKVPKELDQFSADKYRKDGLSCWCKQCISSYRKIYNSENKEKVNEYARKYSKTENGKSYQDQYYENNREEILQQVKEYNQTEKGKEVVRRAMKKFNQTEKGKKLQKKIQQTRTKSGTTARHARERRKIDPHFRIVDALRARSRSVLKGNSKSASTLELLGCSLEYLKQHLESKFQPGMNWENHGKGGWVIDHYVPCSYFDLLIPENQRICFNFRNLQPLWEIDNRKKSSKVPENAEELIEEIKSYLNYGASTNQY